MSDSRLEKFIYAICSMDVSDLPVPLSRIEKLWNCLITGETPDFEPLSRNEKYLMAMLDRYDISNLPAPMSRGEKLLYKIAVGETDLSDVPGYLSRYEELLKYLIENGGISGGDFEYVLYTLNQSLYTLYTTAEKPVKSAILKGNTLVNLSNQKTITITSTASSYEWINNQVRLDSRFFKAGKSYLYESSYSYTNSSFEGKNPVYFVMKKNIDGATESIFAKASNKVIFTIPSDFEEGDYLFMRVHASLGTAIDNTVTCDDIKILEYQDGMENWDIPYFEGMQSVKMPVLTTLDNKWTNIPLSLIENNYETINGWTAIRCSYPSVKVTARLNNFLLNETKFRICMNNIYIINLTDFKEKTMTVSNVEWIGFYTSNGTIGGGTIGNLLEYLTTGTLQLKFEIENEKFYPAYDNSSKSNILTTSEEVELRKIGDVQDELNLLTGELTQRTGKVVLDGSENWSVETEFTNTYRFILKNDDMVNRDWLMVIRNPPFVKSNTFRSLDLRTEAHDLDTEHLTGWDLSRIVLNISKERLSEFSVDALKTYIQKNPITVQYQLATESTKTVDLTIVDQDNQPTQLGTFENVTHVSLEAENLIPEVEMEVATRISTELASASPLMDDISTEQQQLNTTVDEQSDNVDATMIATTEIFEETL